MESIPEIHVRGGHYDIGFKTGALFKSYIKDSVSSAERDYIRRFYSERRGRDVVEKFLETTRRVYPEYVDEMRGIANGSDTDFMEIFFSHIETEIATLTDNLPFNSDVKSCSGCSDLFLPGAGVHMHSEDVSPNIKDSGYLLDAEIVTESKEAQRFTYYSNPGCLAGNAFGIQSGGLCGSVNVVFQKEINLEGIPRRLVNRAMCAASTIEEAVQIAHTPPGPASGFNVNYTQTTDGHLRMTNVEVAGGQGGAIIKQRDITGFSSHFNEFTFLSTPQLIEPSSGWRRDKLTEMTSEKSPEKIDDLKMIMGGSDKFYRNGKPPDFWVTAAVALFDHNKQSLEIYTSNPISSAPILTLPFIK